MEHLTIRVYGKVQDVFFRDNAKKLAEGMGICGYVKNCDDGSVLIEIEGEDDRLDVFIAWCKQGPPGARVEKLEVQSGELQRYKDFQIR